MTTQDLIFIPGVPIRDLGVNTFRIDGSAKGLASRHVLPYGLPSYNITDLIMYGANHTGAPSYDIRMETCSSADGRPSGTLIAANTSLTTTCANGFNVWHLTAAAPVSPGVPFTSGIYPPSSGTPPDASNFCDFYRGLNAIEVCGAPDACMIAASGLTTTGGRSNLTITYTMAPTAVVFKFDDGSYWSQGSNVFSEVYALVYGANYHGLAVILPFNFALYGVEISTTKILTPSDLNIQLLDANNTPLASQTTGNDRDFYAASTNVLQRTFFSTPVNLTNNNLYRIIEKQAADGGDASNYWRLPYANVYDQTVLPYSGNFYRTASTDSGATWTDTKTSLPMMRLIGKVLTPAGHIA